MSELTCPHCGRNLSVGNGAAFCPFCGGMLRKAESTPDDEAARALLLKAEGLSDPEKKHELLLQGMAEHPDSLAIAEELLFLGRLYERSHNRVDFSVIKCYLLNIYLEPEELSPAKIDAMRRELFDHPDLDRCLRLSADPSAFLSRYLFRLSQLFIDLFLKGSSKYMHRFFGLGLDSRAPKLLATPVSRMLAGIQRDPNLTPEQRSLLKYALYTAFTSQVGDAQWLQQEMTERGVALE